jgi:Family of unknown function (DUF6152)
MRSKLVLAVAAVAVFLSLSSSMLAHHGNAAYDVKNPVTVKAKVTDFQFVNPHCQIYFDVKNDKGEIEHWQGELTAPNKLARAGWTKHSLNPGDQITVTGPTGKNNGRSIWIQKLIGPDGQAMKLFED